MIVALVRKFGWTPAEIRGMPMREIKLITEAFELIDWDPRPDLSWMQEGTV